MAKRRRSNGEGAGYQTKDGRWRGSVDLRWQSGHKRDHADGKALLADAGVRDARLHDARHTAVSLLLLLKVPARAVMEVLGHSSCQLTMNTCSHVAPELDQEAAQLMAGALWDRDDAPPSGPRALCLTGRTAGHQGWVLWVVRDGIEPPTPRFSGVCSTS